MRRFAKPVIVISRCLGFEACRYDGDIVDSPFVRALKSWVRVVTVCPEAQLGLGTPRDPVRICRTDSEGTVLLQPETHRDLTSAMQAFSARFAGSLETVDGFILKSNSPSCGLGNCKLFDSTSADARVLGKVSGIFAEEIQERFVGWPMIDERTLDNLRYREMWLSAVFALAHLRQATSKNSLRSIVRFHHYYRSLITAYSSKLCRKMDELITVDHDDLKLLTTAYSRLLRRCFAIPARKPAMVREFAEAVDHFRPFLTKQNVHRYERVRESYLSGQEQAAELRKLIQIWAVRYDKSYIRQHALYRPYPGDLAFI